MAITKNRIIHEVDVFPDGGCRVYYETTFSEGGEEDKTHSGTKVFEKSDTKPPAVMSFLSNVNP